VKLDDNWLKQAPRHEFVYPVRVFEATFGRAPNGPTALPALSCNDSGAKNRKGDA
jgi:hypothetical protein